MKISIVDRQSPQAANARDFVERRLMFALSRFSDKIDRIDVVISDDNGPRGGVDKTCSVLVKLRRLAAIRVSNTDADVESSVARAVERAGRAVTRAVERSQHIDRRRPYVV